MRLIFNFPNPSRLPCKTAKEKHVKAILSDVRKVGRVYEYLISWLGYGSEDYTYGAKDSYEPLFSAIQKVREVLEIETDKLHFYVHHGATPLTERCLNRLLDTISENIGDAKEHIVRRIVPITRSKWNKLYEDLQKAFSKAKPDDTSLSCISLFDHYTHLMDDIQTNWYVKLRQMAAAPDIDLIRFDDMRYDHTEYFPEGFDEVRKRAEALHEAMRKGERLGYVVIGDDRLERCQLKRMVELDPFIRPPSTSGTGPSNDPHSHHVYSVISSHNGVPQPGIYTDGHNSGSRPSKRPYGTNGDTSGRGSRNGGDQDNNRREVADIKQSRRLYDLSYVLYITSDHGMIKYFANHTPDQEDPNLDNSESDKRHFVLTYLWFYVLPPILSNIYKFHDLYYPEAQLEPRTRLELLRRLHTLQEGLKKRLVKYDVHCTLEKVVAEDDGMGFINCNIDDPYERLNSDIEKVYGVLNTEASKMLLHVERKVLPVTDYEVKRILHAAKLGPDMEYDIGRRSRLLKKDELDKIFEALKNAFASVPDSDTSLAYKLVKMHYNSLLTQLETFLVLRQQVFTLDLTSEVELKAFRDSLVDFIAVTNYRIAMTDTKDFGKAVYKAVKDGSRKGYVEIGDDLLTDRPLQYMHELIHSHDRLHLYESSMRQKYLQHQPGSSIGSRHSSSPSVGHLDGTLRSSGSHRGGSVGDNGRSSSNRIDHRSAK
ncbi:hypothetical protein SeLEV6574_g02606 [Synchytrium endobioticum]|uniref:Uncharacterized protein n=1 Tax=Synchytrium endobioticum TaxID=286115 RepID=A0A507D9G1_9FUNG|nr:hypothetical protein SeLEV6574_g02606 [Synchytrium endobioticum]